ncbi:MAG TPA: VCBS repeat-containing protein, partial [Pyrinomonadaceae bacterium]|nr:VCBS repeat-containing protein [Pyrinomonadaceae bacterium]
MTLSAHSVRPYAARLLAAVLLIGLYALARLPEPAEAELSALASDFRFAQTTLPGLGGGEPQRSVREVNPSLRRLDAWVSAVGAAVALNDLDGDGLPNDLCHVDTRTDKVIVAPVPGTPPRYRPFALDPAPLPYDAATTAPMGCLPGDFNEDGLTDLLTYYWGRTPVLFLRRGPGGAAALGADGYARRELLDTGARWYTNAATSADLDGDGHADLVIGNYYPDGARILDARSNVADRMQDSMSLSFTGGPSHLLLWKGGQAGPQPSARFEEAGAGLTTEVARGWTLAVGAADLDGDLLPELYFANDFGPDRLLRNLSTPGRLRFQLLEGRRTLTTPKSKVLGRDSFKGMGVDFGDLNGDGWLDIYVSNIAEEYALEESHFVYLSTGRVEEMRRGVAPYVDRSEPLGLSRSGWGWDARLADFNNDGALEAVQATGFLKGSANHWPDLHELAMGNDGAVSDPRSWPALHAGADLSGHEHNPFFVRAADGRFHDIAARLGMSQTFVSRGIATADVDGDGRLDFAVANQWDASVFYRNEGAGAGAFLGLRL